jgi:hypothetical protein
MEGQLRRSYGIFMGKRRRIEEHALLVGLRPSWQKRAGQTVVSGLVYSSGD